MTAPAISKPLGGAILQSWTDFEGQVNYRFTLAVGIPPRTKKNSQRVLRMGKFNKIVPSSAWIEWRNECRAYVATKPELKLLLSRPMNCRALIYRDRETGDASGYYDGIGDVLEEIGVVLNDKYITQWDGSRLRKDPVNPRVEIVLTVLKEDVQEEIELTNGDNR
jgi:hypothetical protein